MLANYGQIMFLTVDAIVKAITREKNLNRNRKVINKSSNSSQTFLLHCENAWLWLVY